MQEMPSLLRGFIAFLKLTIPEVREVQQQAGPKMRLSLWFLIRRQDRVVRGLFRLLLL
jgi:hypothetical protein